MATVERLVFGDLTIEPRSTDILELAWKGKSTDRQPSRVLMPYITDCITVARERGHGVTLNLVAVDHINSSTITALIQVIQEARSRGVALSLVYDSSKKWQKLGFDALRIFVKGDGFFQLVVQERS